MSIFLEFFYEDNKLPLERVELEDLESEKTYITLDGSRVKVTNERDVYLLKASPLIEGEKVNSLSPKGLELFFKIINKD
jgi:hypothetical protein